MNRRALALLGIAVVLGTVAVATDASRPGGLAADAPTPSVVAPLPFDHGHHKAIFDKVALSCVSCHPVGARAADRTLALPPAPRSSCHGCHVEHTRGVPRRAALDCTTCHAERSQLVPANHGADWTSAHAVEARAFGSTCDRCHTRDACVDCHEGRGARTRSPHAPAFRSTHGIEARLDPASCSSCHVESTCTSCHSSGVVPW